MAQINHLQVGAVRSKHSDTSIIQPFILSQIEKLQMRIHNHTILLQLVLPNTGSIHADLSYERAVTHDGQQAQISKVFIPTEFHNVQVTKKQRQLNDTLIIQKLCFLKIQILQIVMLYQQARDTTKKKKKKDPTVSKSPASPQ
ncbi:hypothetical protein PIB30_012087 [Stylosanthes scabra]|uniref:Uncharacterized protein n=1 Tax=Stylosanthes scabra TaxID=79078 RepID=A0ABU6R4V6_9FABA|nr:hypothetical protein [Stylosanthes scabra]